MHKKPKLGHFCHSFISINSSYQKIDLRWGDEDTSLSSRCWEVSLILSTLAATFRKHWLTMSSALADIKWLLEVEDKKNCKNHPQIVMLHSNIPRRTLKHTNLAILRARSLETRSTFYNTWKEHDMKMKFTSIDFSCRGAEGFRSSRLQTLSNQLIDHSRTLGILTTNVIRCIDYLKYQWSQVNVSIV